MQNLTAFLKPNAAKIEQKPYPASKRFKDETGTPMEWKLRCITSTEDEEIRRSASRRAAGGRGQSAFETDVPLYLGRLAAKCTVFPDLNDASLQDSYGVMGADSLLRAMLTPGEYAAYLQQVQKICGFDVSFDELVDEAKN